MGVLARSAVGLTLTALLVGISGCGGSTDGHSTAQPSRTTTSAGSVGEVVQSRLTAEREPPGPVAANDECGDASVLRAFADETRLSAIERMTLGTVLGTLSQHPLNSSVACFSIDYQVHGIGAARGKSDTRCLAALSELGLLADPDYPGAAAALRQSAARAESVVTSAERHGDRLCDIPPTNHAR